MASLIKIKRSNTPGSLPTSLSAGELAINTGSADHRLYSSDGTTVFAVSAEPALGNTNLAISNVKTGLTTTNTALRTLISDRLQVANAASIYQTKATERAALANTNSAISNVKTGLTSTNTALRLLISDRLQVANAVTLYTTKTNPTTSGLLAHTGRATISTNLAVSGNTTLGAAGKTITSTGAAAHTGTQTISTNLTVSGNTSTNKATVTSRLDASSANTLIGGLSANSSFGTNGYVLKTNGSTVYWGTAGTAGAITASSTDTLTNKTFDTAGTGNVFKINGYGISAKSGTGAVVLANSATLISPALGTPSALVGTNITGTATAFTASNVTTNANLTGDVTSVGNATTLATVATGATTGGSTAIPVITFNNKGLVTAVTTAVVVAPAGTLSGSSLASGVTSSSLTSVGTIATLAAGTVSASGLVAAAGRMTVGTNLNVSGNTVVGGNLTVSGTLTYIDSTTLSLGDNMIKVGNNNIADSIDLGIYQSYVSSGKKYTGLIRDATDGVYKFFYGLVTEPNQTINFGDTTQATIDATIDGGSY